MGTEHLLIFFQWVLELQSTHGVGTYTFKVIKGNMTRSRESNPNSSESKASVQLLEHPCSLCKVGITCSGVDRTKSSKSMMSQEKWKVAPSGIKLMYTNCHFTRLARKSISKHRIRPLFCMQLWDNWPRSFATASVVFSIILLRLRCQGVIVNSVN